MKVRTMGKVRLAVQVRPETYRWLKDIAATTKDDMGQIVDAAIKHYVKSLGQANTDKRLQWAGGSEENETDN